jgi:hypothetical protein
MHVQMLRHFGNWLCVQMLDKDVGVELVDKNPDDIVLLQILANGHQLRFIHRN